MKPALIVSMAASAFMFVSSLVCLILRPDLGGIALLWSAALLASAMMILVSLWRTKSLPANRTPAMAIDLIYSIAVFLMVYTGTLGPTPPDQ